MTDEKETPEYERFKRLAGGLLQVKPEELEEQEEKERARTAPSDGEKPDEEKDA